MKNKMDSSYMGMISEDHSALANLPQNVVQKPYPKGKMGGSYYLDDTIRKIDDNTGDSVRKMKSNKPDSMY